MPLNGNLDWLADQGVLLLNCALTVKESSANSHAKVWEPFTNSLIKYISDKNKSIVFVLWGKFAYNKALLINKTMNHKFVISSHPSGLSNTKPLGNYPAFSNQDQIACINSKLVKPIVIPKL